MPPPPPTSGRCSPNSLCCHTRPSRPPSSLPLSLTVALNPKCSRRSLLGAIFLFLVVARLGQRWCCCRRCRSYRCRRLPRPRGLHYRVLQGSLEGRCGAWVALCMDQKGRGIIVLPTAPGICSEAAPRTLGSGGSVLERGDCSFSWGRGALWWKWGQERRKGLWLPPPRRRDRRWRPMGSLPARPPIRAPVGESLILTPLWREKQACLA